MRVAILSARKGWHTDQLCGALVARGATAQLLTYESLVARLGAARWLPQAAADPGAATESPPSPSAAADHRPFALDADAVLARIIPSGSLEQIIYRVDALHWLEDAGVRVMNSPRAIERSVDKFYTSALLEQAGLATPETVVCERSEDAMAAFRDMGDVIVKPLFGSMGLGMVRVHDEEIAWRVFRTLDAIRGVYYLQRTIDHGGRDVRAFVVGDRVIGAMERRSADGGPEWRTNYSRGGAVRPLTLAPAWTDMAVRAARAVGADYAGVDLLPANDGTVYALEVNAIPGWRGLHEATGIDVAAAIVDQVLRLAASG
jgi:RimK family alpha-L-glutamate ligase